MIRSILLPLADAPPNTGATDFAFWLAQKDGGKICAVALIDIKAFEIPVLGTPDGFLPSVVTPPMQENQSLIEEMTALARERLDQVVAACAARNIPCTAETRTGIPGEIVSRISVAHDIVVMSRTGYGRAAGAQTKTDPLVSHVIRGSIRPVLVAGEKFPAAEGIRNILIAYDGSIHAGRALLVGADLGASPGVNTTIMAVASTKETGEETLSEAEVFLGNHGVVPRKRVVVGSRPSDVICESVAAAEVDILIMGAYGHSPVREVLFGSTTERVLSHCGTTVILQY